MTIIAVKGAEMAADSACFQGNVMFPLPSPKIVRVPGGGLVGAAGATGDCTALRLWAGEGMNFSDPPKLSFSSPDQDSSILWLWLRPDGIVHMGDCTMSHWLVPQPVAIGSGAEFVYGLLEAGVTLACAVSIAIKRIVFLGGDVQVEQIGSTPELGRPGNRWSEH